MIIKQFGMLRKEGEHERSYHSEDKKRSMSREEHRQLKMEKMKLKFRNISNRIKEIKKDNSTDITQLTTLLRSSDEIEKMANQSLQKAKLILSESKLNKKSASPAFHEVRHLRNTATADFSTQPANEQEHRATDPASEVPLCKKSRNSKHSVDPSHTKTDETSESQPHHNDYQIQRISELEIFEQSSLIKEEPAKEEQRQQQGSILIVEQDSRPIMRSSSQNDLSKVNSRYASTHISQLSMRGSLKRSARAPAKRKTESIYPYIAIIIVSIIFLVALRE